MKANWIPAVVLSCSLVGSLHTQGDRPFDTSFGDTSPLSAVMIYKDLDSAVIKISRVTNLGGPENDVVMPMSSVRDIAVTSPRPPAASVARSLLFVGHDAASSSGKLVLVRENNANAWAVVGNAYGENGADFIGVAYSRQLQRIYLADSLKRRIIYADMAHDAGAVPTSWAVLATDTTVPLLAKMENYSMSIEVDDDTNAPTLSLSSAFVAGDDVLRVTDGTTVTYEVITGHLNGAHIEDEVLFAGQTSVGVRGQPFAQVEVVSALTGMLVGSGTVGVGGTTTVSTMPLQLGDRYAARVGNTTYAPYLPTLQSWGVAEQLNGTTAIDFIGKRMAIYAYSGAGIFLVPVTLLPNPAPSTDTTYSATLWIGTPEDRVPIGGGQYALIGPGAFSIPCSASVVKDRPVGGNAVNLPIPGDPDLVGTVLAFQWHVVDGTVKLSNIVGVFVSPFRFVPPGSEELFCAGPAAAAKGATTGVRRPWTAQRRAALEHWLRRYGRKPSLAEKKRLGSILAADRRKK